MMVNDLVGLTMFAVRCIDESIVMYCEDGRIYTLMHNQDCCESVTIDDICGDLSDLEGSPLIVCEESSNVDVTGKYESATWTFYRFATIKGWVTIRWFGESNGYYSESVDMVVDQKNTQDWRDVRLEKLGIE
jgi:hypothetical protein